MCTSIVVGKKATETGITILARNEDYTQNNWNKYMIYRKYPEYSLEAKGKKRYIVDNGIWTLSNGMKVKVPKNEYWYSAMPDSVATRGSKFDIGNDFYFEERGINQKNVGISVTNIMDYNDKIKGIDPYVCQGGVTVAVIPTLLLSQAESAIHAVKLLGSYVEKNGAQNSGGILMGDPKESWYFEIGSGHHWLAVRIPEDKYLVVANGMRIHSVELESENVLHSKGLFEFVIKYKLLENPQKNNFNFAKAFGQIGLVYNTDRIWLMQKMLTSSKMQKIRKKQYPLFLKPDKKISLKDIMKLLRSNYKGTKLEGIGNRPVGVYRTAESHIITFNSLMPNELKGKIWQTPTTPMGSPYIPLFNVLGDIPKSYATGYNRYDERSAYWSFRGLFSLSGLNNNRFRGELEELWKESETQFIDEERLLEKNLLKIYFIKPNAALRIAREYNLGILKQMEELANRKKEIWLTKFTKEMRDPDDKTAVYTDFLI